MIPFCFPVFLCSVDICCFLVQSLLYLIHPLLMVNVRDIGNRIWFDTPFLSDKLKFSKTGYSTVDSRESHRNTVETGRTVRRFLCVSTVTQDTVYSRYTRTCSPGGCASPGEWINVIWLLQQSRVHWPRFHRNCRSQLVT